MIVLPAGHPLEGAWLSQTLRERGIEPTVRHTVSGFGTQFAVVGGLGAATLVPNMATTIAPPDVVCAALEPPLHRRLAPGAADGREW